MSRLDDIKKLYALQNGRGMRHEEFDYRCGWDDAIEFMKKFTEWTGNYMKVHGGWIYRFQAQTISNIKTTEQLIEIFIDEQATRANSRTGEEK